MAQEREFDVGTIVVGAIDVSSHVKNFVTATSALKTATQAKQISNLKNVKAASVIGVADALISVIPMDQETANIASLAVNSISYIYQVVTLPATIGLGTVLSMVAGFVGLFLAIFTVLITYLKKPPTILLEYSADILITPKKTITGIILTADVETVTYHNVGNLSPNIKEAMMGVCDEINQSIAFIPSDGLDFVWKYLARPRGDTFRVPIRAMASGDDEKVTAAFTKSLNDALGSAVRACRDIGVHACALIFLFKIGAAEKVEYAAINLMPELGYEVEGLWRKEIEKLAIRLTRTREYDVELLWGLRASLIQMVAKTMLDGGWWGLDTSGYWYRETYANVLGTFKSMGRDLLEVMEEDPEIRLGLDLVGRELPRPEVVPHPFYIWEGRKYIPDDWKVGARAICKIAKSGSKLVVQPSQRHYLIDKALIYVNDIISDIPEQAHDYVINKLETVEVYVNEDWVRTADFCFNYKPRTGGMVLPYTPVYPWGTYTRCVSQLGTFRLPIYEFPNFAFVNCYIVGFDKNSIHIERITNIPRAINSLVLDLVDVYAFWQKGYGEEWKARMRETVFVESLPGVRMQLKEPTMQIANSYARMPTVAVSVGELEMFTSVMSAVEAQFAEITDYVPVIERNKDLIIKEFGEEEYQSLIQDAMGYRQHLAQRRKELIAQVTQKDITYLLELDLSQVTQEELDAIDSKLDEVLTDLRELIDMRDAEIKKYDQIYLEMRAMT